MRIDSLALESPHIPQAVHVDMQSQDVNQWGESEFLRVGPQSRAPQATEST
ncbi:hypothetical protein D3C77_693280 [compost metagenome]